jgi:hypothetical protein
LHITVILDKDRLLIKFVGDVSELVLIFFVGKGSITKEAVHIVGVLP